MNFLSPSLPGPDTRSTQVFISLVDNSRLDEEGGTAYLVENYPLLDFILRAEIVR